MLFIRKITNVSLLVLLVMSFATISCAFVTSIDHISKPNPCSMLSLFSQVNDNTKKNDPDQDTHSSSIEAAILGRYACTRFQRYDNRNETLEDASTSNPKIVNQARYALDLARRAPSGFNVQPYKVLLVYSPKYKEAMARYCVGHNAHRVRDSDCTAIFLADRQVVQSFGAFRKLLRSQNNSEKTLTRKAILKIQLLVAMFSSGFPLPKWISGPISWVMRFFMRVLSWMSRAHYPLPTLTSSEVWSQKNTMLVAMSYLLACSSQNIATCPMEGYTAWGIRQALRIPRRYTIPLIVATGSPYIRSTDSSIKPKMSTDDTGISHGNGSISTPRFSTEEMIYNDVFGKTSH